MPAFSVSPVAGIPPPVAQEFPDFLQLQSNGTDLGLADADTIDFASGLRATRGTGENSNVVTVAAGPMTWREITTSDTLTAADLGNGIDSTGADPVSITIPLDAGDEFDSRGVLIFQSGAGAVSFTADVGVQLLFRSALLASMAGQYATATLIQREANVWILCGDLQAA